MNDRYSRLADQLASRAAGAPEPAPRFGFKAAPRPRPETPATVESLALSPEELRRLAAAGAISGNGLAARVEKNGRDAGVPEQGLRTQWMDVTPALARRWLANNFRNRPVKEDTVAAYARDMAAGRWLATHQGVAFNDRDELIDGQHRLLAIVRAGVTVRMMVTFGLPAKPLRAGDEMTTMDAVDRGATRSVADQLKIQHGLKEGHLIAMVTRSIASLCSTERTRRLSVGQTLEIFRAFEPGVVFVIEHRSRQAGLRCAGVLAGFAFAMAATAGTPGALQIAVWFKWLNSGERLAEVPALAKLRDFLTSDEASLLMRTHDRALAELTTQAIRVAAMGGPAGEVAVTTQGREHFARLIPDRVEQVARLFRLPEEARA